MTVDSLTFRKALGQFATGVGVVTGRRPDGRPVGLTVNAFSSLSLDPPLVLFCVTSAARVRDPLVDGDRFAVNVLAEDQESLSRLFSGPDHDPFAKVPFETWNGGVPILSGCLANLECTRVAVHPGGDHDIVVGRVERLSYTESRSPLLFFRGRYVRAAERS